MCVNVLTFVVSCGNKLCMLTVIKVSSLPPFWTCHLIAYINGSYLFGYTEWLIHLYHGSLILETWSLHIISLSQPEKPGRRKSGRSFWQISHSTGCCQHQRLPWLCLNNCMEFSSFQTRIPVQELHFSIVIKMLFLLSDTNLPHHCPFFCLTSVALIFVTPHLYIEAIYNFDLLCCTLLDLFWDCKGEGEDMTCMQCWKL